MAVDNRNFIIEDCPSEDDDNILDELTDDDDEVMSPVSSTPSNQQYTPPPPQAPWTQRPVYSNPYQSYQPSTNYWPQSQYQPYQSRPPYWNSYPQPKPTQQQNSTRIDRRKKIIFCDLIDILIESESAILEYQQSNISGANNYKKLGISPRGLYDIRLKTDIWYKLAAFRADYIFCLTNQPTKSEDELKTWEVMTNYVMYALADYLNLPHDNCRCITKLGFELTEDTKPNLGLIKKALCYIDNPRYKKSDCVIIGANSGYQNQSNVDRLMAKRAGIDYVDVNDLLTTYY